MRTNKHLEDRMYEIWDDYFSDIPRKNLVLIKFGKYSRRQLGSIKWAHQRSRVKALLNKFKDEHDVQDDKRVTIITITKYFEDFKVPQSVVDMTIAHEMVHYSHGFHSPLPKMFSHPHRGNVVNKELATRGLEKQLRYSEEWIKKNWVKFVKGFKK